MQSDSGAKIQISNNKRYRREEACSVLGRETGHEKQLEDRPTIIFQAKLRSEHIRNQRRT